MNEQWNIELRPTKIDDMLLSDKLKETFKIMIKNNSINNILLFGKNGIGKTTIAKILVNELEAECLEINASSKTGIDNIRTQVERFSKIIALDNKLKIVILTEADGLSHAAQQALNDTIEESSKSTRFIFTTNNLNKIIPAISSRCTPINIQHNLKDMCLYIFNILHKKNIILSQEDKKLVVTIVKKNFPDIRLILGILELSCLTGKFVFDETIIPNGIENIVNYIITNIDSHQKCRTYWINNEEKFQRDYVALTTVLYNYCYNNNLTGNIMVEIGESLYRQSLVLDKEIEFSTLIFKLQTLLGKGKLL